MTAVSIVIAAVVYLITNAQYSKIDDQLIGYLYALQNTNIVLFVLGLCVVMASAFMLLSGSNDFTDEEVIRMFVVLPLSFLLGAIACSIIIGEVSPANESPFDTLRFSFGLVMYLVSILTLQLVPE